MEKPDSLAKFLTRFDYHPDENDRWTLLLHDPKGDCEDFALTVAWLLAGSWWRLWWGVITLRFVFWHCWARGDRLAPHIALWVRGRGWIDNIVPHFGPRVHPLRFPLLAPLLAVVLLLKARQQ